ncbi:MAG: hypothetical protein HON98_05080 [Chloroflexi bacterium]|jgi:hypothetical protein|nr:hypothetical protein [Chloroflexota bacterium]MBT3670232.1 hypothetical protein [Chloroflexota bacterium]MBT4003762.1 hypothetical protein [Chloroflexota bacterium]MBT4306094.1 hypothetical protein [Chloroflexota bacterium]MBT4534474.1 hypothetical protein [Chloroflexota bacterium]
MKVIYLLLRIIRRLLPEKITRFLLRHEIFIAPGLETTDPDQAVDAYINRLKEANISIVGKRILVFGYGGSFGSACELLAAGASHVTLTDLFAPINNSRNRKVQKKFSNYLSLNEKAVVPKPEFITLIHGDIVDRAKDIVVDIVFSNSVYEHLDGIDKITKALASCTAKDGSQVHFIDLRDHVFNDPFRMLTFSKETWLKWLNPTSHHNRHRLWDYQKAFENNYKNVDIKVLEREIEPLEKLREQIKPEFLSGDIEKDSVTLISVLVSNPK